MPETQETQIALIKQEVQGLREQQKSHADEMRLSMANLLSSQNNVNNWLQQNMNIPAEHKELWNYHQNQKGFLKASNLFWGMIGSAFIAMLGWLTGYVHK